MAESLLASLYSRIKGSQEDVATVSLQYILSSSEKLNYAFNKLLSESLRINLEEDVHYTCQVVGADMERPDMSGVNRNGCEILLCEMKFYASLTDNQPNGYIDRLIKNNGKALVFVCPESRKMSLWHKLVDLCKSQDRTISDEFDYRVNVDGIVMCVLTWNRIIDELRRVAASDALESKSDIDQLAGFCSMMDNTAFIPFSPEELDPLLARKEERIYQVLDKLYDKLIANKSLEASGKGLKASPWRGGYTRYLRIHGCGVALIYNRFAWIDNSNEDTPFWFYITDGDWHQSDELKDKMRGVLDYKKTIIDNKISLALVPLFHATLDEVADDLMRQIHDYLRIISDDVMA